MAAFTYSNNTGDAIVDLATISQTINVYGSTAPLTGVSVAILGLTHTFSGDLDMLLVAPNGTDNLVFWSDAGSVNDLNGVYIIQDGSTGLTELGMVPAGAYGPGAFSLGDPLETDATFGSSTGALNFAQTDGSATFASSFSGDPTGNWTIYIHDDTAADSGAFTGLQVIVGNAATTAQIDGTAVRTRSS
ncbi:MAG: hypothetical protein R3D89_12115 [Sphingomonadaceae bacterium]